MGKFRREIVWTPAYDKRDPNPGKSYGIHGVTMTWYLHGSYGVMQFVVYTGWHLKHVDKELKCESTRSGYPYCARKPMAADIGYHSPVPRYEGQDPMSDICEVLGGVCYYDGSSLAAEEIFNTLIEKGEEATWKRIEDRYTSTFEVPEGEEADAHVPDV